VPVSVTLTREVRTPSMQPAERIVIKGDQVGVERKRKPLWRCAL
jgi:hypothetical protein